jgi:hypothetical protein
MWSGQVTGEEDELRKEGELEKGRQRERESRTCMRCSQKWAQHRPQRAVLCFSPK